MLLFTGQMFGNAAGGGGGGPTYPLDGLSPTGAWSASRDLLTSWVGNARYTTSTGVNSFKDQTGGGRHLDAEAGVPSAEPGVTTAGPNSKTCLDFTNDDRLLTTGGISNFISASSGYAIWSGYIDAIDTNVTGDANVYQNDLLWGDQGGETGVTLLSGGPIASAFNFSSYPWNVVSQSISTGVAVVVTWRHEGGNLYISINGGAETSVASGNTADLTSKLVLGRATGGYLDGKCFEFATWSTVPSSGTRATLIADFMTHIGAV
jgi:hypothetical protein